MSQIITRRGMLGGLISAMAAPAIVRAASLMPVRAVALYGRSPLMLANQSMEELNAVLNRMLDLIVAEARVDLASLARPHMLHLDASDRIRVTPIGRAQLYRIC